MNVTQTRRLRLRWFVPGDAAFILELVNEPGWLQYIGDRNVHSIADAHQYLETVPLASYRDNGFGLFAVDRLEDGITVGMCGLIRRPVLDDVDIGFAMLARYGGRGYASEAAAATLDYARDVAGLPRIVAITTQDNTRSARVLEAIGMHFDRLVTLPPETRPLRLFTIDLAVQ